jgi:acetylornithine deacetylase/succinyl-diaminopimelate desuccinylase-like protein
VTGGCGDGRASRAALEEALAHGRRRDVRARWAGLLSRVVALPTVGSSPQCRAALERAAELLRNELSLIGLRRCSVLRSDAGAPPSVWGEWRGAQGRPLLLLYGHFDVQPPGAAEAWVDPPFDGSLARGRVHGRGASDNKGPLVAHLAGLENWFSTAGRLPLNVRVWLEGEEETGSPHLGRFLERYGDLLRADGIVLSDDTRFTVHGRPTVITGLRGLIDLRLTVAGPGTALHSGTFGGEVLDPGTTLAALLASLKSIDGRIAVPGFYRDAVIPDAAQRQGLAVGRPSRSYLAKAAAIDTEQLRGERQWEPGERSTLRPSLTVTELTTGQRSTVTPSAVPVSAAARINLRLVPHQRPKQVTALLRRHLQGVAPPGTRYRLEVLASADPVLVPSRHPLVAAARRALAATWQMPPVEVRSGGTIPVVPALAGRFGMPAAMWGLSRPGDHIHGPDESFALSDLYRGTEVVTRLLYEICS